MFNEDPFLAFVHQEAIKKGKLFMLDSGEGRGFIDSGTEWYVEDLSGWLIEPADQEKFVQMPDRKTAYDNFGEAYVFAIWSKSDNGEITISFKKY